MIQLLEEAERSVKEALIWLKKCEGDSEESSIHFNLWRAAESLDYAALLISLSFQLSEFYPELDVEQPDVGSSSLRFVEETVKEALKRLRTDPRVAYKLLKDCLLTLRALRGLR